MEDALIAPPPFTNNDAAIGLSLVRFINKLFGSANVYSSTKVFFNLSVSDEKLNVKIGLLKGSNTANGRPASETDALGGVNAPTLGSTLTAVRVNTGGGGGGGGGGGVDEVTVTNTFSPPTTNKSNLQFFQQFVPSKTSLSGKISNLQIYTQ